MIVDEVHMLSTAAFNAFLKTPPFGLWASAALRTRSQKAFLRDRRVGEARLFGLLSFDSVQSRVSYLVIDLEATCDERHRIPREETEIIEIGAVLVDLELVQVDAWQTFVRPVIHPLLTPFCTRLTSIEQAQVDSAPSFREAIAGLAAFLSVRTPIFCSWGDYDRAQLTREAERNGVTLPLGQQHFNIKQAFNQRIGDGKPRGVGQALKYLGLRFEGTAHRAIDDARNIARLLPYALGRTPLPRR